MPKTTEYTIKIQNLVGKLKAELTEEKEKLKAIRKYSNLKESDFFEIFTLRANILLTKRRQDRAFVIDSNNKALLSQLYYYLIGDKRFKGDLNKGIWIGGKIGTGKTLIMDVFRSFLNPVLSGNVVKLHSKQIVKKDNMNLSKRHLFIDDIGKEAKAINDFGTVKNPIIDLITERYDNFAWTFTTCNYSKESLIQFYGETIFDRFVEMFNIITLNGESRRV